MATTVSGSTAFHGPHASVRTYLTAEVITIAPSASARDAAVAIAGASVGVLVICDEGHVTGLVSERDLVRAMAQGLDLDEVAVADIGSSEIIWIDADDTIGDAAEEMMEDFVRHVLVRDGTGLTGVLSIRDVLSAYIT